MTLDAVHFFFLNLFGPLRWMWFVMGACIGSFISMATYRIPLILEAKEKGLPAGMTLSYPPSKCPCCTKPLKAWANVPIFGYLLSRGKCAHCEVKIPVRYLALELVAATWALAATFLWSSPVAVGAWSIFGWCLFAMAWMDAESQWLPNCLTVPLLGLGLMFSTQPEALINFKTAIVSAGAAYLVFETISFLARLVWGADGLGGGDVKLITAIGVWFGGPATIYITTSAFALFIAYYAIGRKSGKTAFGPMLCCSALTFSLLLKMTPGMAQHFAYGLVI